MLLGKELAVLRGLSFEEFDIRIIAGPPNAAPRQYTCINALLSTHAVLELRSNVQHEVVEVTRGARWLEAPARRLLELEQGCAETPTEQQQLLVQDCNYLQ